MDSSASRSAGPQNSRVHRLPLLRLFALTALSLALCLIGSSAFAQPDGKPDRAPATFDMEEDHLRVIRLDGLWRFQVGDDPDGAKGWASPTFNDSAWPLIHSDKSWSEQGYKGMGGSAWYRARVNIPAGSKPLALFPGNIWTSYQVFADGQFIGGVGGMPPHGRAYYRPFECFKLPAVEARQSKTVVLAVRVWHWPTTATFAGGGMLGNMRIGDPAILANLIDQLDMDTAWGSLNSILLATLQSLAALAALALFLFRPTAREYLWFSLMMLFSSAIHWLGVYMQFHLFALQLNDLIGQSLLVLATLASIGFYRRMLRGKRGLFFWLAVASAVAALLPATLEWYDEINLALLRGSVTILALPPALWIVGLQIRRAIQGYPDARLLFVPTFLIKFATIFTFAFLLGEATGWYSLPGTEEGLGWYSPFFFTLGDVADALFLLAMLAILINRFTRTQRHEESHQRELEAAREVQEQLITPAVDLPGFTIESVYLPAKQVGGDFFRVLPEDDGSVLMVSGDVSGKGLKAAMAVSAIMGALRGCPSRRPAGVLQYLNHVLSGQLSGFATCCVAHITADGAMTLANAGNPAPYYNGIEMAVEPGLPLGIVAALTYTETHYQIAPGQRLTFVSDGVIEATSPTGELFGFDRTEGISNQSAQSIADAVKHFGQEDDITILTLTRLAPV